MMGVRAGSAPKNRPLPNKGPFRHELVEHLTEALSDTRAGPLESEVARRFGDRGGRLHSVADPHGVDQRETDFIRRDPPRSTPA